MAGAHDDVVAALERDVLFLRGGVEVVVGDAVAVVERVDALVARHVEQHAAADHLVLGLLDAALLRAGRGHLAAVVAVPHPLLIEHVAEPVPLRAALQRHGHHVVGGADAALVEHAGIGVGAGADHGVDRIGAAHRRIFALGALRPGVVEVERERDHLAFLHQLRGGDDVLRAREVERADLVVRAPFAPVLVFLRSVAEVLPRVLSSSPLSTLAVPVDHSRKHRLPAVFAARQHSPFTRPRAGAMMAPNNKIREDAVTAIIRSLVCCSSRWRCGPGASAQTYPNKTDQDDRAVRARRPDRRDRAHHRAEGERELGPAGRGREHPRRRRQYRRRHGGCARRPTATPSWR